jgi:anti-sigma factor RsiW
MTEHNEDVPTREELEEIEHLAQAMAYQAGDLNPTERAAFEAHLPTCKICPAAMAASGEHWKQLSALGGAATFTPKYTVDEQVQRFDAMVKAEREAKRAPDEPWLARYWGRLVLGAAAAAAAAVLLVMRTPSASTGPDHMYAPVDDSVPRAPRVDGGIDAG